MYSFLRLYFLFSLFLIFIKYKYILVYFQQKLEKDSQMNTKCLIAVKTGIPKIGYEHYKGQPNQKINCDQLQCANARIINVVASHSS